MELKETLEKRVSDYVSTDFVKVSINDSAVEAAAAMRKGSSTEAVIVDGGVAGIVTERDILFKVVAEGRDPKATKVGAIMTAPVQTVEDGMSVGDAIATMSKLGVRRLGVTSKGKFVGLVTQKTLIAGKLGQRVPLPELAEPAKLSCPYCGASAKDSKDLSKHIDQVHLGLGLLEGNRNKW